jgi:predicted DNA-binding transcriptional regulator AlpA
MSERSRPVRETALPLSLPPRGLRRTEAAAYVGISPSMFDQMIEAGLMPRPKRFGGRVIWDRREIDDAFDCLPGGECAKAEPPNPWDQVHN